MRPVPFEHYPQGGSGRKTIVVGGGLGGLTAALELRRAGFDVSVFERRKRIAEVNTGLSLWAFAIRRLREQGIGESLDMIGQPIRRLVHLTWRERPLSEIALPPLEARVGASSYDVHRGRLLSLLADAVGYEWIHLGQNCVGAHEEGGQVWARFDSGLEASAQLLIAADGVNSTVRSGVVAPPELRRGDAAVWRGIASIGPDEIPPGLHLRYLGPGALFGIARIDEREVRWYAGARFPDSPPRSNAEAKELALQRFRSWSPRVLATLERTPEADYLFNDTPHAPPLRRWTNGRIALLGDAAHPTFPSLGIAGGMAIEDAAVLGECLRRMSDPRRALRAYERRRQPTTARILRAAVALERVLMISREPAYTLRQLAWRLAPQALALRWLIAGGTLQARC